MAHFDRDKIDYSKFSSNIPITLDYAVNPNGGGTFQAASTNDELKCYIDNGCVRMVGSAIDASNTLAGAIIVATLPLTLIAGINTPMQAKHITGLSTVTDVVALLNTQNVRVEFTAGATDAVHLRAEWNLATGNPE